MTNQSSTNPLTTASVNRDPSLQELISRILGKQRLIDGTDRPVFWPGSGTLSAFNQMLENQPVADFVNYTLRGIGQVIFVNNPVSGALILLALFVQSAGVGWLSLLGVLSSAVAALVLGLDRGAIRNGIYGYNGLLVGAALATFGDLEAGAGGWAIATIFFAASTTVLMNTAGVWWAKCFRSPPLTLPFNVATLVCLALSQAFSASALPLLPPLPLAAAADVTASSSWPNSGWLGLIEALPVSFGQVFLADRLIAGGLVLLAVAICTPLGAAVGLFGGLIGTLTGLLLGVPMGPLSLGLWGYNGVLSAMAVGGVFYAPTGRSIFVGLAAAFLSALAGGLLGLVFAPAGLPVLTLPFCFVTTFAFVQLARSLPSLVPVALHAVTSPEEHYGRYQAAKSVITHFRQQLAAALSPQADHYLSEQASSQTKGDLKYLFNRIDTDQSGTLSVRELRTRLDEDAQAASVAEELAYLFSRMDRNGDGKIDFEEFSELMLRHQRLMANYDAFMTYFLPLDADGDDAISSAELNLAVQSVGMRPFSKEEQTYLQKSVGDRPLTWNQFVERLLLT